MVIVSFQTGVLDIHTYIISTYLDDTLRFLDGTMGNQLDIPHRRGQRAAAALIGSGRMNPPCGYLLLLKGSLSLMPAGPFDRRKGYARRQILADGDGASSNSQTRALMATGHNIVWKVLSSNARC